MSFIFFEDRDIETGHGWRDLPKEELRKYDIIFPFGNDEKFALQHRENFDRIFPFNSYFWITPRDYFEEHGHIHDNIRTSDIIDSEPSFKGVDDMESHFEFKMMNPREARKHLEFIGIKDGYKLFPDEK